LPFSLPDTLVAAATAIAVLPGSCAPFSALLPRQMMRWLLQLIISPLTLRWLAYFHTP
jgi:hypothetical protein